MEKLSGKIFVERKSKILDKKQSWLYISSLSGLDYLLEQQLQTRNLPTQCSSGSWRSLLLNAQLHACFFLLIPSIYFLYALLSFDRMLPSTFLLCFPWCSILMFYCSLNSYYPPPSTCFPFICMNLFPLLEFIVLTSHKILEDSIWWEPSFEDENS